MFERNSFSENSFETNSWFMDLITSISKAGKLISAKLPSYLRSKAPYFLRRK